MCRNFLRLAFYGHDEESHLPMVRNEDLRELPQSRGVPPTPGETVEEQPVNRSHCSSVPIMRKTVTDERV